MATKTKSQFLTKTSVFGGKKIVMYSIDGLIWSTRKEELSIIKDRLDNQRITLELATKEGDDKTNKKEKIETKEEKEEPEIEEDEFKDVPLDDVINEEAIALAAKKLKSTKISSPPIKNLKSKSNVKSKGKMPPKKSKPSKLGKHNLKKRAA